MNEEKICVKGIDEILVFSLNTKTKEFFVLNNKFDGVNSVQDFIEFLNNLQKENKQLKGSLETHEILLKANAEENQKLKEKLQQKEDIINKAKENLQKHLNEKNYGNHKYELFGREYLEDLLETLDNKGE